MDEGYVFHLPATGRPAHAAAALATLRRHDRTRPATLCIAAAHRDALEDAADGFEHVAVVPDEHATPGGFALHLDRYRFYARTLATDTFGAWCRAPDPLWYALAPFAFTASGTYHSTTGWDGLRPTRLLGSLRRRDACRAFGLSGLPDVSGTVFFVQDDDTARRVCTAARAFLARRDETPFPPESWTWSLAAALTRLGLPLYEERQGLGSLLIAHTPGHAWHDAAFENVTARHSTSPLPDALADALPRAVRPLVQRLADARPAAYAATPVRLALPPHLPAWDAFANRTRTFSA